MPMIKFKISVKAGEKDMHVEYTDKLNSDNSDTRDIDDDDYYDFEAEPSESNSKYGHAKVMVAEKKAGNYADSDFKIADRCSSPTEGDNFVLTNADLP